MSLSVALNASILRAPRTGIGQYLVELVEALTSTAEYELKLFNGWRWLDELPAASLPGYSRWASLARRYVPNAYRVRRWTEQRRFDRAVAAQPVALYHEPSLWPLEFEGPMVMTLHDLTHVHYPETQPRDRLREIERHAGRAVQRAQRILVDSQFIAGELCDYYGLTPERVVVAPLGCAARFHPRDSAILREPLQALGLEPDGYLLCVGTLEPRKNLGVALRAYRGLPAALRARFPLLIVGMAGWHPDRLAPELAEALRSGQVRLLGYQEDEMLARLLAGARVLLFPSLYEGFGLPVLEAMASGTPVVVGNCPALAEVAGTAGAYADCHDPRAYGLAVQRLLEDPAEWQARRDAGLRRAADFSWARCAQITAGVYRQAVNG
ncbi:MAG: glycosyltransferase family 1 protein [Pseudomonas sp.]|uniref:glycosyltransferase family 4 protein n=1 Tax=Pseudomonas sp. TaxID=306 RepID=UPI003395F64D